MKRIKYYILYKIQCYKITNCAGKMKNVLLVGSISKNMYKKNWIALKTYINKHI